MKRAELSNVLQEVVSQAEDMNQEAKMEELEPGKKRKRVLDSYLNQAEDYKRFTQVVLDRSQEGQWILKRMRWVPSIERHLKEGQGILSKGRQLLEQGLTYDEVRMRGEKLPLEENQYIGETVCGLFNRALRVLRDGSVQCIGIYGHAGAGKTNLMKRLYNEIFEDQEGFKAVFWATAPNFENDRRNYNKALQKCVADGMWVDLENDVVHDEARSAGKLMARLQDIGSGKAVFFLDNVKHEFSAYELLGIPSLMTPESTNVNCILVFSTLSRDVCNRMQCDLPLKMDLLEKTEAEELFLHEVRCGENHRLLSNQERRIQRLAIKVANECARMPLAIIIIARSMVNIKDLSEWQNRLNELMNTISSIHDEEDKILEQLKFGYHRLKDNTVQHCFLVAANLLVNDRQVSKRQIIEKWKNSGLIGMDRPSAYADDQGHAVLNQLERMCLIQVAPDLSTLTMNKWICKMANRVT
ncbi:hypothetical protein BVRB_7g168660 [Beta vulgaris subsp. vulgaris]|nr:hypothetical protein BVRB_7g168660 [Beta vulgaris subsp. vulgaris]